MAKCRPGSTPQRGLDARSVGRPGAGRSRKKALEALIAFFIAVVAYISIRFEPKMALAAFLAMLHDLLVTVGIYSLFGFQVTPDTVDRDPHDPRLLALRHRRRLRPDPRQHEALRSVGDMTYSAMVNLSMNQTLARSINTSMVAILPVLAVLLVGADLLGRDHAAELRRGAHRRTDLAVRTRRSSSPRRCSRS